MKVKPNDLKFNKSREKYSAGYRIVYFYDDYYSVGEYCKTIEGFMIGFAKTNPILDEESVPKFISIDDLLTRYLNDLKNVQTVALYDVNGECIASKSIAKDKNF